MKNEEMMKKIYGFNTQIYLLLSLHHQSVWLIIKRANSDQQINIYRQ